MVTTAFSNSSKNIRVFRFYVCLVIIIAGGLVNSTKASGFNFKSGIGYDFISQEFFLDSAILSGPDSIITSWSLTNNYLDDLKGFFSATYIPYNDNRIKIYAKYEQTADFIKTKWTGDFTTKVGKSKFTMNNELDWRHRYSDSAAVGDSYIFGYTKAKLAIPTGQSTKTIIQWQGEFVQFDSVSNLNYNYYRVGGKIGFEKIFQNFSFGDIKLTLMSRQVPDSSALNYLNIGLESSFFGYYDGGDFDYFTRLEKKNYNQPENKNDYVRFEFDARNKIKLGHKYFTRQEINIEYNNFDPADLVNLDYYIIEFSLLTGYENDDISVALGPDLELFKENNSLLSAGDDYFEASAKLSFDIMKYNLLFSSFENMLGYRNLVENDELRTDFTFERINLLGDINIYRGLNFNFLFSAEWEWHNIKSNNSQIYLLSSSLSYSF